ncbi:hypothetical protein pipiens_019473 [Culex pipiens pipiens]|uniref:Uncharacterized protein n=1 Tax=Culex pipiens pipiens TaxID=38569 RepID=A0ABD1DUP2_CULPP
MIAAPLSGSWRWTKVFSDSIRTALLFHGSTSGAGPSKLAAVWRGLWGGGGVNLLSVNFNKKLASLQVDHEFVQDKQWSFWELDHKSTLAPSADAKTKPAPRTLLNSRPLRQTIAANGAVLSRRFKSKTTGKPAWNAFYIIEAIILGGVDVRTFPLAKRSALCTKFANTLNLPLYHLSPTRSARFRFAPSSSVERFKSRKTQRFYIPLLEVDRIFGPKWHDLSERRVS